MADIRALRETVRARESNYHPHPFGFASEQFVNVEELPAAPLLAVLLTEDPFFYQHNGFSWRAFRRRTAEWASGESRFGIGSSISQQLIKIAFSLMNYRVLRKPYELLLTSRLEREFTKEEILSLYVSGIRLSELSFGVSAASKEYFGKEVHALSLAESCFLAFAIHAPRKVEIAFRAGSSHPQISNFLRIKVMELLTFVIYAQKQAPWAEAAPIEWEVCRAALSSFEELPEVAALSAEQYHRVHWMMVDELVRFEADYGLPVSEALIH